MSDRIDADAAAAANWEKIKQANAGDQELNRRDQAVSTVAYIINRMEKAARRLRRQKAPPQWVLAMLDDLSRRIDQEVKPALLRYREERVNKRPNFELGVAWYRRRIPVGPVLAAVVLYGLVMWSAMNTRPSKPIDPTPCWSANVNLANVARAGGGLDERAEGNPWFECTAAGGFAIIDDLPTYGAES